MSDLVAMPFIHYNQRQLEPFKHSDSPCGGTLATDIFPAFQYSEGLHFKTHRIDGTGPLRYIKYKINVKTKKYDERRDIYTMYRMGEGFQ